MSSLPFAPRQCGWYQKLNCELPAGTAIVCWSLLLPLNGVEAPSWAATAPECALDVIAGSGAPAALGAQPEKLPVSKPPFATTSTPAAETVRPTVVECVAPEPVPVTVIV